MNNQKYIHWNQNNNMPQNILDTIEPISEFGYPQITVTITILLGCSHCIPIPQGLKGSSIMCQMKAHYNPKISASNSLEHDRVFSLNFWWGGGGLKIFGPRRSPTGTKSDGGGDLRKKSDWSQNCPLSAKSGYFLLL